jgi:hypothetical protein
MNRLGHLLTATMLLCIASAKSQEVTFSTHGGFYETPFELTLSGYSPDKVIHYTTNGNTPTADDPVYSNALIIDQSLYSHSDIFKVRTSPEDLWYAPETVQKCIVIRAAAFNDEGQRIGNVVTNSYFIRSLNSYSNNLPVMSLCADSLDLFDHERGILVPGIHYSPENEYSGNYYLTGSEWERQCNIEFYEQGNGGINQRAGVRTHGNSTRRYPQKGLKIYAREEYGKKRFKYKFFDDTDVESFKHLKLKPFRGSWTGAGCQDYISGRITKQLDIDCLSSRPMVLFINGEYWGIYYLQEKPDERYIEDHYDIDLNTINMVNTWDGVGCEFGSGEALRNLFEWVNGHDLSEDDNYQYVKERIDISNFIDYEIFEIFSSNLDWPAVNMRCWQAGNSLWRWLFFDGDACIFRPLSQFDAIANAIYEGEQLYPSNKTATLFFRKLMSNPTFKSKFLERFEQLLSTVFSYANTKPIFEDAQAQIAEEISRQSSRFNNPESIESWETSMLEIDQFLAGRISDLSNRLFELYALAENSTSIQSIYPVPTHDELHIITESNETGLVDIIIYNCYGERVFSTKAVIPSDPHETVIRPDLPNGIYLLKVGTDIRKFIVSR